MDYRDYFREIRETEEIKFHTSKLRLLIGLSPCLTQEVPDIQA